jgi:repressor LexA
LKGGEIVIELYKNIKTLREQKGLSQEELARMTGYTSRSSIAKIEKGEVDLTRSKIIAFANALGTSPGKLMGWDKAHELQDNQGVSNIYPIELKRFPMLGEIACGIPKYTNEDRESYVLAGTEIKADFCLKAKGDSMINARIQDGDIVFIHKQDTVENGEIAAVVVNNDSEATLKRFFYYQDKALMILKPENPAYEDFIFQGDELNNIHILGKAVAFQSDVK